MRRSLLLGEEITGPLQLPLISPESAWSQGRGLWVGPAQRVETQGDRDECFPAWQHDTLPLHTLNMRVQIDLAHAPPPNHRLPSKTDSFMCGYHVTACRCSAGSGGLSEACTSRQEGRTRRGRGEREARGRHFLWGAKHAHRGTRFLCPSRRFPCLWQ